MLPQNLFKFLNKIALLAIVFASLAPSISHALQANSSAGFVQEVCTTSGEKITIQVLTTKGQQLATELPAQGSQKSPAGIQHHLQHCPFCASPSIDAALQAPHAPIIVFLTATAQHIAAATQVISTPFSTLPPPAQAPPSFN